MKAVTKLKDDARRHELREDWEKAIEVYLKVIRIGEQGETDLELPLYNRLGDLYVRVGKPDDAVLYYEQAADRYAEAGLFNNAIALCNKALRYAPDHLELIRKLGQFSASQGFLTDARRWFLDFAERAARQGRTDDALTALEDFASTADDADVRELLGRRLHQYGREDDAVAELRRAYRMYLGEGDEQKANDVRAFLAEIAPDVSLADEQPEAPATRERPADDYARSMMVSEAEAEPERGAEAERAADDDTEAGTEAGTEADASAEADAEEVEQIDDLVSTMVGGPNTIVSEADLLEGFEATAFETAPEDEIADGAYDLPDLEPTGLDEPEALPSLEEEQARVRDALPALDTAESDASEDDAFDGDDAAVALPLLHEDGDTTPDAGPAPAVEFDEPLDDLDDALLAARAAVAMADVAGAVDQLHELQERLDDAASFARVTREIDDMLVLAPDDIRLHQVRVEFAEQSDDTALRLTSYLELARSLERTNARNKAIAMYEHVREIAPDNVDAAAALARMNPPAANEYVDLKSLFDLDQPTGETRYFVEEREPTGDEDSDFASILSQFKAKLAEHVAPEDAGAHYDLGIAFKEMGLVDEAIAEFQVALRAGDDRLRIYEELGHCFLLKEQYTVATKVLGRALEMPSSDEIERIGVYYHLGRAYEQLGRTADARDAYERVMSLDISFRDVAARLAGL